MDTELRQLLRETNIQRRKAQSLKSQSLSDFEKYKLLRIQSKQLISKKKKEHALKLGNLCSNIQNIFVIYIENYKD